PPLFCLVGLDDSTHPTPTPTPGRQFDRDDPVAGRLARSDEAHRMGYQALDLLQPALSLLLRVARSGRSNPDAARYMAPRGTGDLSLSRVAGRTFSDRSGHKDHLARR